MKAQSYQRHGTRVRAQIPVRLTSLEPVNTFSENCHTLMVNPRGCGIRFPRSLQPGSRVKVDRLPGGGSATAHVACSLPPSNGSKFWIIGISVDTPGNVWCLAPAPEDWGENAAVPKFFPASVGLAAADLRASGAPARRN